MILPYDVLSFDLQCFRVLHYMEYGDRSDLQSPNETCGICSTLNMLLLYSAFLITITSICMVSTFTSLSTSYIDQSAFSNDFFFEPIIRSYIPLYCDTRFSNISFELFKVMVIQNWSLQFFGQNYDQASHTTFVVCVNFIRKLDRFL